MFSLRIKPSQTVKDNVKATPPNGAHWPVICVRGGGGGCGGWIRGRGLREVMRPKKRGWGGVRSSGIRERWALGLCVSQRGMVLEFSSAD